MPRIVDQKGLVEYTGFSRYTIGELTRKKKIPHFRPPGVNRYYYDLDKIDKWLEGLQEGGGDSE